LTTPEELLSLVEVKTRLVHTPPWPGTFVAFEGGDACGKTTQVSMLAEKLTLLGIPTAATSFPRYGEATGKAIGRHLRGETWVTDGYDYGLGDTINVRRAPEDALFFQALQTLDKYEEAANILKILESGGVVVSSRWYQSAEVYGADDGLDAAMLRRAHACLPKADVNILLHLSSDASLALRPDLRDRFERDRAKQDRIRQSYLDMWWDKEAAARFRARSSFADGCDHRWDVVYCEGKSAEEVHDEVWDVVLRVPGFAARIAAAVKLVFGKTP
jgi:dTMP kinase